MHLWVKAGLGFFLQGLRNTCMRNFYEHFPIKLKPCVSDLKVLGCGEVGTMFRAGPRISSRKARSAPLWGFGGWVVPTEQAENCQRVSSYRL